MSEETNKLLESIIAYQKVLKKQIVQYEERIDKAIEFINYYTIEHTFEDFKSMSLNDDELTELLEILKGDSNE